MSKGTDSSSVMPEVSRSSVPRTEAEVEPNYLAYHIHEIEELFAQEENLISSLYSKNPISYARTCTTVKDNGIDDGHCKSKEGVALSYSNTLSYNGVGDGLSVLKKERLKASLNESVNVINHEVDEVLHSVLGMYKIKKILRDREHIANNPISADADVSQSPVKKKKLLHSPSSKGVAKRAEVASSSEGVDTKECNVVSSEESQPRDLGRICLECKTTITPQWREGPDGTLCNACGIRNKKKGMSPLKVENKMKQEASSSEGIDAKECNVVSSEESQPRGLGRICLECKTTRTPQWREGPDGTLCNACGIRNKKKGMSPLKVEKRMKQELDDDLQFLLDVEGLHAKEVVKEVLKKYSDELAEKLGHMEQQLEKYLDVIMSKCRKMTKEEKLELRKLIRNLPPKNLDRVVDIIAQHRKLPEGHPCNEICIDLENEDNATLWRLYYYAEAVANAKKFQE